MEASIGILQTPSEAWYVLAVWCVLVVRGFVLLSKGSNR